MSKVTGVVTYCVRAWHVSLIKAKASSTRSSSIPIIKVLLPAFKKPPVEESLVARMFASINSLAKRFESLS